MDNSENIEKRPVEACGSVERRIVTKMRKLHETSFWIAEEPSDSNFEPYEAGLALSRRLQAHYLHTIPWEVIFLCYLHFYLTRLGRYRRYLADL
jgi:hypothetical protein